MRATVNLKNGDSLKIVCPVDEEFNEVVSFDAHRFKGHLFFFPTYLSSGQILNMRRGKILERAKKFATFRKAMRDLITKTKPSKTEVIVLEL